jgi:hypothetical protein
MSQQAGRPKRAEMVVINDDLETPSLLNPVEGKIFVTNRVGKRIMELADGTRTVDDIVEQIFREFRGTQKEVISNEVQAFLKESGEKWLITWDHE